MVRRDVTVERDGQGGIADGTDEGFVTANTL